MNLSGSGHTWLPPGFVFAVTWRGRGKHVCGFRAVEYVFPWVEKESTYSIFHHWVIVSTPSVF